MVAFARPVTAERPPRTGVILGWTAVVSLFVVTLLGVPVSARAMSNARPPRSPHGALDLPCGQCHGSDGFRPARISREFDHATYGFALEGAHRAADCLACHRSLEFESLDATCAQCHADVHAGSFGNDCERCHATRSFIDRSDQLAMHQLTQFPLTGRHGTLDCVQCHGSATVAADFVGTATDCYVCHRPDFETATPDHQQAGFGTDCSECHGTVAWTGAGIGSHDFFPLVGGHGGLECSSCHTTGAFARLDPSCASCHRTDYDATTRPAHQAAGFTLDCEGCHTVQGWESGAFDHATTSFALTGAHVGVDCARCHTQPTYSAAPDDCNGCHDADYAATIDPNHVSGGFPFDCELCHTTSTWDGATFDHSLSRFPLTGAHRSVECAQCHVGGVYTDTSVDCIGCHRTDYETTTDPAHLAAGFGTDCESCHTTSGWDGADFDHDANWFPIYTGRHAQQWDDCADCHTNVSSYAVFDCLTCHEHADRAQVDADHRGESGYRYDSQACYDCHPRGRE